MQIRPRTLGVLLALASYAVAVAQPAPASERDATAELRAVLDRAAPELAACAYALGRPTDSIARLTFDVSLDARARLRATVERESPAPGRSDRCLGRAVRRAVARARPRLVGPAHVVLHPFAALSVPTPAPEAPRLASHSETIALREAMRRAPDDAARLAMLETEVANHRVSRPGSSFLVATLRTRQLEAALRMCGILLGDDARERLADVVPREHRAYFLAVTERGCGVPIPSDGAFPTAPAPPECNVDADCVLVPRAPPSCCGDSCRGGVSVPRSAAASLTAQCREREPGRCPAVACAYEPGVPVCRAGRCGIGDGFMPGR